MVRFSSPGRRAMHPTRAENHGRWKAGRHLEVLPPNTWLWGHKTARFYRTGGAESSVPRRGSERVIEAGEDGGPLAADTDVDAADNVRPDDPAQPDARRHLEAVE